MPILAIRGNRRQETVSMPEYSLNEQNGNIIFGIPLMERHVLAFKGEAIAWDSPFIKKPRKSWELVKVVVGLHVCRFQLRSLLSFPWFL